MKKKVIAFVFDYYMDTYGYAPVRPYGLELDEKGESLFFYVNAVSVPGSRRIRCLSPCDGLASSMYGYRRRRGSEKTCNRNRLQPHRPQPYEEKS